MNTFLSVVAILLLILSAVAVGVWATVDIAGRGVDQMIERPLRFWTWLFLANLGFQIVLGAFGGFLAFWAFQKAGDFGERVSYQGAWFWPGLLFWCGLAFGGALTLAYVVITLLS